MNDNVRPPPRRAKPSASAVVLVGSMWATPARPSLLQDLTRSARRLIPASVLQRVAAAGSAGAPRTAGWSTLVPRAGPLANSRGARRFQSVSLAKAPADGANEIEVPTQPSKLVDLRPQDSGILLSDACLPVAAPPAPLPPRPAAAPGPADAVRRIFSAPALDARRLGPLTLDALLFTEERETPQVSNESWDDDFAGDADDVAGIPKAVAVPEKLRLAQQRVADGASAMRAFVARIAQIRAAYDAVGAAYVTAGGRADALKAQFAPRLECVQVLLDASDADADVEQLAAPSAAADDDDSIEWPDSDDDVGACLAAPAGRPVIVERPCLAGHLSLERRHDLSQQIFGDGAASGGRVCVGPERMPHIIEHWLDPLHADLDAHLGALLCL